MDKEQIEKTQEEFDKKMYELQRDKIGECLWNWYARYNQLKREKKDFPTERFKKSCGNIRVEGKWASDYATGMEDLRYDYHKFRTEASQNYEFKEKIFASKNYLSYKVALPFLLTFFFIFNFLFNVELIKGNSMYPTINNGDIMLVQHSGYKVERGYIIVAKTDIDVEVVKRVVGVGGDVIDRVGNTFYVNGTPTTNWRMDNTVIGDLQYPLTIPEGKYFVVGDNANASTDSRVAMFGLISEDKIKGAKIGYLHHIHKKNIDDGFFKSLFKYIYNREKYRNQGFFVET